MTGVMTIEEAIYCMESYLLGNEYSCAKCPYYGSVKVGRNARTCTSGEAHRMAIKALKEQLSRRESTS